MPARGDLLAQRIEPGEDIPSSRDKAAAPVLDIAHRAKPIVFRIEQPVEMVERVLAPGRGDRLYPRKCHCPRAYWRDPADFPRAALDLAQRRGDIAEPVLQQGADLAQYRHRSAPRIAA